MNNRPMTAPEQIKWIRRLEELMSLWDDDLRRGRGAASRARDKISRHFERTGLSFGEERTNKPHTDDELAAWHVRHFIVDRYIDDGGVYKRLADNEDTRSMQDLVVYTLLNDGPRSAFELVQSFHEKKPTGR